MMPTGKSQDLGVMISWRDSNTYNDEYSTLVALQLAEVCAEDWLVLRSLAVEDTASYERQLRPTNGSFPREMADDHSLCS